MRRSLGGKNIERDARRLRALIPSSFTFNVRNAGALGTYADDASLAVDAIVTNKDCGVIYFPCIGGQRTIYHFKTAVAVPQGFSLSVDAGAVLWIDQARWGDVSFILNQEVRTEWFGADGQAAATGSGCSIGLGSTSLTVDSVSTFKVGNGIVVPGAGVAGADLFARIVSISGTTFTLDTAASTAVGSVRCLEDDSIAINSAIQTCFVNTTINNKVLRFNDGLTQLYQVITLDKGEMHICGSHRTKTVILQNGVGVDMFHLRTIAAYNFSDLRLMVYNGTCIDATGYTEIDAYINDCWFVGETTGSIGIDAVFSTTTIDNCIFETIETGILLQPMSGYVNISNILFSGIDNTAIYAVGDSGHHIRDINISNITYPVDQPGGALPCIIRAEYCDNLNINNIAARNQLTAPAGYLYCGIYLVNCNRVGISNINMLNVASAGLGMFINACADVRAVNYTCIADAGYEPVNGLYIANSDGIDVSQITIIGTDGNAIYLSGTQTSINIHHGRILNTGVADNSKPAILACAGNVHISDIYLFSSASYSDYAIDPTGISAGSYFIFEKCSVDGFTGGLWDVSILPANVTGRTVARDLDIAGGVGSLGASATPSVAYGYDVYVTTGGSITYTNFPNGYPGQDIRIVTNDANKIFDFTGAYLKGNNGTSYAAGSGDALRCFCSGTVWYCDIIQG